jgi:pimeloyl-ACP methyl ester carboxylesterase
VVGKGAYANGSTPTVLLVHGAFTDSSIWAGVVAELLRTGNPVIAPANPLRGLTQDATYLGGVAANIDGPVVLVGYAYGGSVITLAGLLTDNIVGLVYVAAMMPDKGESARDLTDRFPPSRLDDALRPETYSPEIGPPATELLLRSDQYPAVFGHDLAPGQTTVMAVSQRPVAASVFEERVSAAAWRTLPSWYVVATADQILHPDAQRFMAARAGSVAIEVAASHAVAVSHPAEVAAHIRVCTQATRVHTTTSQVDNPPMEATS